MIIFCGYSSTLVLVGLKICGNKKKIVESSFKYVKGPSLNIHYIFVSEWGGEILCFNITSIITV